MEETQHESQPLLLRSWFRWLAAGIGLVVFAIATPLANDLQFDRSITAMFDPADPDLQSYQQLQADFGGNAVAMLVYHDPKLWTTEGIERNHVITDQVAAVAGVSGVLSPSILNDAVKQIRPGSFLSRSPPLLDRRDSVARGFDQMFVGYTHSPDHEQGAVVAMLEPAETSKAIAGLRDVVSRWQQADGISDVVLVGEPVLVEEAFALIQRDGDWLAALTVGLLSIVVFLSLLDLRFVLLSMVTILWSVTLTKAVLVVAGVQLSLVSTILTAIVTVISVTSVLHLGVRFQVMRRRGRTTLIAMATAFSLLWLPITWTCATDAAGFAALSVSRIAPVQQFGWMIAVAALSVLAGLGLWAPLLMSLRSPAWISAISNGIARTVVLPLQRWMRRRLRQIAAWSVHHPAVMGSLCAVAVGVILLGIGRTRTETSFLNNFQPDSNIVRAYERVENQFGGAGVWDVVLEAPDEITNGYLKQVRQLERDLRDIDLDGVRLTKVISLADADVVASRARLLRLVSPTVRLGGMQVTMPVFYAALMSEPGLSDAGKPSPRRLRLMLRSREDIDAEKKTALIAEVLRLVRESELIQNEEANSRAPGGEFAVTGYYVLMTRLIGQLIGDGWRCFAASALLVWILLMMAAKSVRRATVVLSVNLLPALLVLAVLGIRGGTINMGSAMIAAVSIGLSIDGSVHFLASYRRKLRRGHTRKNAAIHAASSIGVPIALATIALVLGFGGLATSEFVPTSTFGLLVAVTLVLGTIVNLTILPALVAKC